VDAWVVVHGPAGGFTAGQAELLDNVPSKLDHRVDYVLYQPRGVEAVAAEVLGEELEDRTRLGCGRPTMPGWSPRCTWHTHNRPSRQGHPHRFGRRQGHTAHIVRTT
jgi:hypothetical protein